MEDETKPPFPEKLKDGSSTSTTTTTESVVTGKASLSNDTVIAGASGRFWIAFVLAIGLVLLPVLWLLLAFFGTSIDEGKFGIVYGAYAGGAVMGVGTYLGQNKPKTT